MVDLEDEIYRSSVLPPTAKRQQIAVFSKFLELIVILTDVLTLVFPFEHSLMPKRGLQDDDVNLNKCNSGLKGWYRRAIEEFPPYEGESGYRSKENQEPNKSLILQTNLMYIYYQ